MSDPDVPAEETQSASDSATRGSEATPLPQDRERPLLRGDPDRYEIIAEHGRGGLGRVSRAHDRSLGRDIAIKELIKPSPVAELRFLREALITARLEHPGIVPVHEAGRWPDGTPFYAMKLVSGRPLRELIRERPTVAARLDLLQHVIAVADAIAYAHGRGIIHRDLKPANVIVGEFGETVVIDWGLAKDLSRADDERVDGLPSPSASPSPELTSTGVILGTPAYMAPEQARGEQVDQRADVFAIGAMLWELCSLERVPPLELTLRHRLLDQAGIDHDLAAIIDKAIDPAPARRYPDAGALAADLKAFKAGARIAARSYSLPQMLAHWTRHHRALTGGAIAFAALIIASVIALAVLYNASERNATTAQARLIQSYVEQGRRLSLDGEYLRALPYLAEAYAAGERSIGVQVMLARAERLASAALAIHRHAVMQTGRINERGIAARFRPDGQVISASETGEAAIWDPVTGRDVATLPADARCQPCAQRISDDGRFVAVGSKAGVTLWSGATPRLLATGPADRLAIDPGGERIAVAHGTTIAVWHVATGERMWTASTAQPIVQLAWDGDAIVVGLADLTAQVVTADRTTQLALEGQIFTFTVGPRGTIATVSDGRVDLWDAAGARLRTIDTHAVAIALAFSADEERLVLAKNSTVQIFSHHGRQLDFEFTAHLGALRGLSLSHDNALLATVGNDQSIKIWRLADHQLRVTLLGARTTYSLAAPQFDATDTRLVAATGRDARVFATSNPDAVMTVIAAEHIEDVRLLTDGRFATSGDHEVQLWSSETGAELAHIARPANSRDTISRDGRWLASYVYDGPGGRAGGDAMLELYDVAAHAVRQRIPGPAADAAAFSLDGTKLAMAGADHGVDIWSTSGQRLAQLHGHTAQVSMTSFGPDDRLLSLGRDRTIRIWDLATGQTLAQTATPTTQRFAAISASGRRVVSVDGRLTYMYDATTLAPLGTFEHEGRVVWADLSPDDKLLAAGTIHGAVDIWDATTGTVLTEFHHEGLASAVEFSADGTRLLSASEDRTAVLWRVDRETRPAAVVSAFVRCHAPYRLVETRLEPAEPVCD